MVIFYFIYFNYWAIEYFILPKEQIFGSQAKTVITTITYTNLECIVLHVVCIAVSIEF